MSEGLRALVRSATGEPEGALVLFHGRGADEHDPVISVGWSRAARAALEAAGAVVTYRESSLPHTIDPRLLPELRAFVAQALGL